MSYALWNPTAYYLIDDEVLHLGSLYKSIADNFDSEPPSANWVLIPPIGGVNSVVAGSNVTITGTPSNPVVNAIIPPSFVETLTVGTNLANVGTATNPILDVSINANIDMNSYEIQKSGNISFNQFVGDARLDGCKEVKAFGGADLNLNNDGGGSIVFTTNSSARGSVNGIGQWNFNGPVSMNQYDLQSVGYISSNNSNIVIEQLNSLGNITFLVNGAATMSMDASSVAFGLPPIYTGVPLTNGTLANKQYVDSKVFNPIVGSFSSSTTQLQTGGIASTATPITYDTTEYATSGVSVVNNSEIKVTKTGVYKFSYSVQLDKSGGGNSICEIWIRINGNNVPRSASQCVVAGQTGETFPFCEYILPLNANDSVEVIFMSADATMAVTFFPASGTAPNDVPVTPSIIANIIQIS